MLERVAGVAIAASILSGAAFAEDAPNVTLRPPLSIGAPPGTGWKVLRENDSSLVFGRYVPEGREIAYAGVFLLDRDQDEEGFIGEVKTSLFDAAQSQPDTEIIELRVALSRERPYLCARGSAVVAVRTSQDTPATRTYRMLMCRTPNDPEQGFGAYFAYPSDTGASDRDGDAEKFIAGVQVINPAREAPKAPAK